MKWNFSSDSGWRLRALMAIKDDQVGHRIESQENQKMTVRLTCDQFDALRTWAAESQISGIFEAVALVIPPENRSGAFEK
jgi:hypothetical protein